jgi:diguanylate cyclase (GGDEF)-like protein
MVSGTSRVGHRPDRAGTAYVFLVVVTGIALAVALGRSAELLFDSVVWALAALLLLGELAPLEVRRRESRVGLIFSTTFVFALLLYAGPPTAVLVAAGASILADSINRLPWDRVVFNAGQYIVSLAAAGAVLTGLGHAPGTLAVGGMGLADLWPVVVSGVTLFLVNHVLVGLVIALVHDLPVLPTLLEDYGFQAASTGMMLALAPLVVVVAVQSLVFVPVLFLLGLVIHRGTRMSIAREHEALHDALTGLPNRGLLLQHIDLAIQRAAGDSWPAVIQVNLDRFSDVNDTLGHDAGDDLLHQVAQRLQATVAEGSLVGRLAADEFAVLVQASDVSAAEGQAKRLLEALGHPFTVAGLPLHVRACAGVVVYPQHGSDSGSLMRHADVALRHAKDRNRATEVYRPERDQHTRRRLGIVSDLRGAIGAGHVVAHFQPQAQLATGAVVGAEALVRWHHPTLGMVSPAEFIPLAERTGLIKQLTRHMLDLSLAQCALWQQARWGLSVSVNISVAGLDRELPEVVRELLDQHGVPADRLELEVTESSVMAEPEEACQLLEMLRDMGVRLAIDDFGTGHSSLAYLEQLPFSTLKVDRSFTQRVHSDGGAAIIRATVEMARTLGMTVVAEGAEDPGDWEALSALGCELVQGFLLTPALGPPELMAWLLDQEVKEAGGSRTVRVAVPGERRPGTVTLLARRLDAR